MAVDFSDGKLESFKLALNAANIGVWELSTSSMKLSLSDNIFDFMKIDKRIFDGQYESFINLIHPQDQIQTREIINQAWVKKIPFDTEFRVHFTDSEERWFRIRGNVGEQKNGIELKIFGSIHDKTERKLAYENLEERVVERTSELQNINRKLREEISQNRKMKKIIMDIGDKERQKIGQDLHDSLSQQLGGILYMVQSLEGKLKKENDEDLNDLNKIKKYLDNTLKYVRNLAKGLNLTFGETGLKFALTELTEQMYELYGLKISLKLESWKDISNEKKAMNVFRIIQEALNNAVKHGKAKEAAIEMVQKKDQIFLSIADRGMGFSPNPNKKGMGLKIMEYRASQVGGNFKVSNIPGKGVEVLCVFPSELDQ